MERFGSFQMSHTETNSDSLALESMLFLQAKDTLGAIETIIIGSDNGSHI